MNNFLEVKALYKSFGALKATDGVDLEGQEGETHAVIGPNRAGKTTVISQLAGELLRRAGPVCVAARPRLRHHQEPMAGMGVDESQRMIALLATLKRKQTIVLVEHDMDAVFRLADRISVLVYGRIIATGAPEEIRMNEEVRKAYLGEDA